MTTLAAVHRRLWGMIDQTRQIDDMLADAEKAEAGGDAPLSPLEASRFMIRLDGLASRLGVLGDRLADMGPFKPVDAPVSDSVPVKTWKA